jgi:hypothetical protein
MRSETLKRMLHFQLQFQVRRVQSHSSRERARGQDAAALRSSRHRHPVRLWLRIPGGGDLIIAVGVGVINLAVNIVVSQELVTFAVHLLLHLPVHRRTLVGIPAATHPLSSFTRAHMDARVKAGECLGDRRATQRLCCSRGNTPRVARLAAGGRAVPTEQEARACHHSRTLAT